MVDETDLREEFRAFYEHFGRRAASALKRRGLEADYIPSRGEALARILEMIPPGSTVGWGDSVTLHEVGVISAIKKSGRYQVLDPFARDEEGYLLVTGDARLELERRVLLADVYLSGTNAITLDGRLVNTDGVGNRVAPMIFGPKKVIIVAGANKIVRNVEEAIKRIREIAAPINARRHILKHHMSERYGELPCIRAICPDCLHPRRICCYTVIIEGERAPYSVTNYLPRIHVIIIGERLGI
jgi:hypothetical protein